MSEIQIKELPINSSGATAPTLVLTKKTTFKELNEYRNESAENLNFIDELWQYEIGDSFSWDTGLEIGKMLSSNSDEIIYECFIKKGIIKNDLESGNLDLRLYFSTDFID